MSSVDTTTSILSKYGSTESTSKSTSNDLSKDAFLSLLVTQLQYQDPLNPTQDKEFLAQMAQFTSLEQMQNLNKSFDMSQGYALLGKAIKATIVNETTNKTEDVEGFVESSIMKAGKTYLVVDGKNIALEDVTDVSYVDFESASVASLQEISDTLEAIQEKLDELTQDNDVEEETT